MLCNVCNDYIMQSLTLMPCYQIWIHNIIFVRFLLQHGGRALVADKIGVGKTLHAQVCTPILSSQFFITLNRKIPCKFSHHKIPFRIILFGNFGRFLILNSINYQFFCHRPRGRRDKRHIFGLIIPAVEPRHLISVC